MADPPEVRRGAGGDPVNAPLPQGQATAVNEATPSPAEAQQPGLQPAAPDQALELPALRPPQQTRYTPQDDEEKFLFGPSEQPGEVPGNQPVRGDIRLPEAPDWLPLLQQTALDPTAPQQVRDLFDLISNGLP